MSNCYTVIENITNIKKNVRSFFAENFKSNFTVPVFLYNCATERLLLILVNSHIPFKVHDNILSSVVSMSWNILEFL
jgi:hypothetical protein